MDFCIRSGEYVLSAADIEAMGGRDLIDRLRYLTRPPDEGEPDVGRD
jgi:hypothetical protein